VSERSVAEIEAWLLSHLRERLGPQADDVDAHLPFSYYGLDSLDAVALAAELEEWLGESVTPDIAWDHPTAHAVASYLGAVDSPEVEAGAADETLAALLSELEEGDPAR
jgi:acyl carrier protein